MGAHVLDISSRFVVVFLVSHYLLTNLQWYNYSFVRVFSKHHKKAWHLYYLLLPSAMLLLSRDLYYGVPFYLYAFIIALPMHALWTSKLDKKLVYTGRVLRTFGTIVAFVTMNEILMHSGEMHSRLVGVLCASSMTFGFLISNLFEWKLFENYKKIARSKLESMKKLRVVVIAGSYGKTSIKNFLYELTKEKYSAHATPKSVNTIKGIVSDINRNLDPSVELYIVEAGARSKGDILEISNLLNQHYSVIAKVGAAHIEYFRDLRNTMQCKLEALCSNRIEAAFLHEENGKVEVNPRFAHNLEKIRTYPGNLRNVKTTLEGTSFDIQVDGVWEHFKTNILGRFNVDNICVAISVAHELKVDMNKIRRVVGRLEPVPHRLQKIVANNKIILDDSFNGNVEGMNEAIRLCSLYNGRRVIVTPGLIEHNEDSNAELAKKIDKVFDLVIITGDLNATVLSENINQSQKVILKDKSQLEEMLKIFGRDKDLILFANDAPNYI